MTWAVLACGAIVVVTEPLTIALLRRLMVIDLPGHRSSHSVPTPRGGGAPIALGLLVAAVLATAFGSRQLAHPVPGAAGEALAFGFAVAFFGVLGLIDDLRGLPASRRLVLQAAGSAFVAGMLAGRLDLPVPVLAVIALAIVVWLAGFVNAFNFMDGVNGISGVHALIGGVAYACLGQWRHDAFMVTAGLAVAAAACAFLPWNAFRARVFLGDVGSYSLGAALALLAACAVLRGVPVEAAAGPVALYLADTAWTLLRRIRRGENWLEPHRTHVYQRWCDVGWSHQEVSLLTAGCTVLLCLLGTVSAVGAAPARLAADLAGVAVLVAYLRSPELMGRPRTERARHANPYSHALLPARDGCPAGPAIGARANVGRRRR